VTGWRAALAVLLLGLAGPAAASELRPFVAGSWSALRTAHAGRPLVVGFWSQTCLPCLAEMPVWSRFVRSHPGVAVVLVATDPLDEADALRRLLRRHGVEALENWAFADDFVESLRFEIDPDWRGELPRSYLIAPSGTVTAITGLMDEARLRSWLAVP